MNETTQLPSHFSPEAHALFRAYQEIWKAKDGVISRAGEAYWHVCRASLYSILEAIVCMDDPTVGGRLKETKRES